jgi:hypothetical protein|tara:strand:+ start:2080 stop:2355 length:276 start_codon:yes stop_codon:yes gene_type:complete
MKSIFILIFFAIIIWLTYNYSYNKYYTDKIEKDIQFILLPQTISDQFKYQKIDYIFNSKSPNSNYNTESDTSNNTKSNSKKVSMQRYFTEF